MVRLLDVLSARVLPIGAFLYVIFLVFWDVFFHAPLGIWPCGVWCSRPLGYLFLGLRVWGRGGCG